MRFPKIKFLLKKTPSLKSLHKEVFRTKFFWAMALSLFVALSLMVALVGIFFFRSVYFEDYRNESELQSEVESSFNVNTLKNAIQKRNALLQGTSTIPRDPSM